MSRLIEELRAIVGEENATDDIAICASYSRDQHWHFVPAKNPAYVVRPCNKEVRQVLMLANREKIPVIPYSTGINVRGLTIPVHDGKVQCGDNRADVGTNAISCGDINSTSRLYPLLSYLPSPFSSICYK